MFKPEKDERLWRIELEAGMTAFLTYFFLTMALLIARGFTDVAILSEPDFLLIVPWLFTGFVFIGVEWKKGYYSAIREESQRTESRRAESRSTLILSIIGFTVTKFLIERLNLFSEEVESITWDLIDAVVFGLTMGFVMWFLTGRRTRNKRKAAAQD